MLLVSFARFTQVGLSGNFSNLRRWGSLKIEWFGCGIHSSSWEFSALSICLVFELPGRCDVFDVNFFGFRPQGCDSDHMQFCQTVLCWLRP